MGKPIVYCHGCGKSLLEADFDRGRASRVDDRPYCAACRKPAPPPVKPPPATRRHRATTSRIPIVAPPRERSRPKPPLVFAAAGGGAILVVVLLAVALSRGGGTAPAPADPLAEVQRLLASGAEAEAVLRKCDEVRPRVAGTPAEARFREIEGRARRERSEREKSLSSRTEAALARIRQVAASDPGFLRQADVSALYSRAMKEAGPREADVEREWLGYERKLETAARAAVEEAKAEADRLAAAGDLAGAIARLDRLSPAIRATAPGKSLEAQRKELEERLRIARLPPPPPPSAEVVLDAGEARVRGEKIAIKERDGRKYVGNWHRDADVVEFTARVPRAGRYRVHLEYATTAGAGGELVALFGAEKIEARIAATGDWRTYAAVALGEVALPAGEVAVLLQGRGVSGEGLMNLRRLRLAPP